MINVVIGQTGSGKSYFVKKQLQDIKKNLTIFDFEAEYKLKKSKFISHYSEFLENQFDHNTILRYLYFDDYYKTMEYLRHCKNYIFVIEELNKIADSRKFPDSLKDITLTHRHRNAVVYLITQSPTCIPTLQLTNATHIFLFKLERAELENLKRKIFISELQIETVSRLKQGQFLTLK